MYFFSFFLCWNLFVNSVNCRCELPCTDNSTSQINALLHFVPNQVIYQLYCGEHMKNVQHFQAEPIKPRSVSINTIVWNQSGKFETEIKLAHFAWLDCRIGIQFLLEDFLWSMVPRRDSIAFLWTQILPSIVNRFMYVSMISTQTDKLYALCRKL